VHYHLPSLLFDLVPFCLDRFVSDGLIVLSVIALPADTRGPNAEEASMLIAIIED
jgi:hypothetical protein